MGWTDKIAGLTPTMGWMITCDATYCIIYTVSIVVQNR
jgi:hypothetical protein